MKRILIRISALATVVVLGLIAIAQAQRGVEDSPPAVAESVASDSAPLKEGEPRPILVPPSSGSRGAPRILPGDAGSNPLRHADSRSVPLQRVRPVGASTDPGPRRVDDVSPVRVSPGAETRRADPFAVQGGTVGDRAAAPPVRPEQGGVVMPPSTVPGPSSRRSPQHTQPASIPEADRSASGTGEPGPLRLDPNEPTRSIAQPIAVGGERLAPLATGEGTSETPLAGEGEGTPGNEQLEGAQTPQLTIRKSAPPEIQVGKPATFEVTVKNSGQVAANGVEIRDRIPEGTRLIDTTPQASRGVGGELVWELGTLASGDEVTVATQLMPTAEGEIGSVATVHFRADASVRTTATKPELAIETSGPEQVLIGEETTFSIVVSNPGSGTASGVILQEQIPAGMQHPAGAQLEYEIGELKPKETRRLELTMIAARPGPTSNVLTARGDANLRAEDRLDLEVIAPQLDVTLAGPKRRYLEREATYTVSVSNPGTAPAQKVELVVHLPGGLKFVRANNAGQYEAESHAIHWLLEELPVNETGTVELTAMPIEPGQQTLRLCGTADHGLVVEQEQAILVEGIAAILFEVVDVEDPIEVGGQTSYEIRVLNQGTKAAANIRMEVSVPPEMRVVAAEGPCEHRLNGNQVLFEGLSRLAPKADSTFRVRVQGLQPGDLRIRVQLLTDEMQVPVIKEESTRVYSDE